MTDDPCWAEVDRLLEARLGGPDPLLEKALAANRAAGLPAIDVSPLHARLLALLASSICARRILEVGTLGGYSTLALGRALTKGGRLISLEVDPRHAEVARGNLADAGLDQCVEVRVGAALELLPALEGPFDLAFLDADKENNARYFAHCLRLVRPGGLILVDNVVRAGAILAPEGNLQAQGALELFAGVAAAAQVEATVIQTVGVKGWDGLLLARVRD